MWLNEAEMGQRTHDLLVSILDKYGLPDTPAIQHWRQFTRTLGSAGSGFMTADQYFASYGEQAKALLDWLMNQAPEWIAAHMSPEKRAAKGIELPQAEAAPLINHRVYHLTEGVDTMTLSKADYQNIPLSEGGWLNVLGQQISSVIADIAEEYGLPARDELVTYAAYVLNETGGQSLMTPAEFFESHPDTTAAIVHWLMDDGSDWIEAQDARRTKPRKNGHIRR